MKMGCVKEAPLYVYLTISITNHNHLLFTTIRLVRSPIVWGFRPELEFSIKRMIFLYFDEFCILPGNPLEKRLFVDISVPVCQAFQLANICEFMFPRFDQNNYKIIQKQWQPNWPLYIKLLVLLSCVNQRTGELDPSLESFWDCEPSFILAFEACK